MKHVLEIAAAVMLVAFIADVNLARAGGCANQSRVAQSLEAESIIDDVAMAHALDPGLLSAIARVESNECPDAVSSKGAAGLMQLMPATAAEFGVDDRFDPVQNTLGAARLIDYLQRSRPDGKLGLPETLAAYNAGEGAVARAGGVPHYRETEEYVRRVLWLYLVGHVPKSERDRDAAAVHATHPRKLVAHSAIKRRPTDDDSAVLDEISELRRSRQSAAAIDSRRTPVALKTSIISADVTSGTR